MRILILQSELGVLRGGGENFTRNLFTAFAARGHSVAAAFVADWGGKYPLPLPSSIEPIPIPGWWSRNLGQTTLASMSSYLTSEGQLRAAMDRVQDAVAWRSCAWHNRRFQRRIEKIFAKRWTDFDGVYVHADPTLASRVSQHRPTVLRLPGPVAPELAPTLRAVHTVCANGDALQNLRAFLHDQVVELPIGLDTESFTPGMSSVRSNLGWSASHFVVGYVGRLTHLKGVDLLAAAFREALGKAPEARLLLVGAGEEEQHIRTVLANEIGRGFVHIEPGVDHEELPAWFRAMDLMVMPSRYENHSNALLEAMACGLPFLVSHVGGNRKLSESGAGWLFEPGSAPALSRALCHILGSGPQPKMRGEVARRSVCNHHSWASTPKALRNSLCRVS